MHKFFLHDLKKNIRKQYKDWTIKCELTNIFIFCFLSASINKCIPKTFPQKRLSLLFAFSLFISAFEHIRMLILSIDVLLACINTIYKYGQAWVI